MQDAGFVKQAFAGIARRYVLANHVLSLGIDVLWRKKTAGLVAARKPSRILDLATGSGDLATTVQQACPNAKVLGGDFSVPMMREAQKGGLRALVAADGMNLPFQDASFDVLTVAFGLRNMASWPEALKEMRRVLKPGGTLFVLDFSIPTLPLIRPAYLFYLKRIMPRIAGWITGQRASYEYLCSSIERFPSGRDMESLMTSCDFSRVTSHRLTMGIASLYEAEK
ncbi:ubiquinone/menaquinone biosynthesis methyltransferase [Brevifollis gellanilyticus]|uniref:Demethylmenaquinone methyltransferase n=1 Tax=Brevifollis gellanilyticus TaxID=748831 RepID=A0A512MFR9_9BACT|nr:ubiquinone/menaquinone biosynthesis methyltransferase [Brevifollis gellanilyticus]GEP45577.1 demethylmenaquinone methyltransferase [Brevifollis gellanilyticus]